MQLKTVFFFSLSAFFFFFRTLVSTPLSVVTNRTVACLREATAKTEVSQTLRATKGLLVRRMASSRRARSVLLCPVPCGPPSPKSVALLPCGGFPQSWAFQAAVLRRCGCVYSTGARRVRFSGLQTTQRQCKPGGSPPPQNTSQMPRVLHVASRPGLPFPPCAPFRRSTPGVEARHYAFPQIARWLQCARCPAESLYLSYA